LGERRANATMVSRLSAKPSGHWEKLSRRAIFPNVWPLRDSCGNRSRVLSATENEVMKIKRSNHRKPAIA
ncbi:hypothetical protein, partial [Flavobacterium macacae]|uniref:hypothetical protein n=1 Tax=Flavobacterium macacae TaxID=2488993 RepID=UPI0018F70B85